MTDEKKDIMKKLKGLLSHQERVHYIKFGSGYNGQKVYFRTAQEAIQMYQALGETMPISIEKSQLYKWNYKAIEKDLEGKDFTFAFLNDKLTIELGSEVIDAYDSEAQAKKAEREKDEELKNLNKLAEEKKDVKKQVEAVKADEKESIPF